MSSEAVSPGPQMTAEWIPLGQRLLERGLVSGQELERALDLQRRLGGRLGGILVRSGAISENTLMQVLAEQLRLPLVGGRPAEAERRVHRRIPAQYPDQYRLVRRRATGGLGGGRATAVRGA
ncbi:hypothetical protein V2201_22350 [Pseudomonas aeruginosa]|nr:hypothetical protein [Pseudomonas aeruginosa]